MIDDPRVVAVEIVECGEPLVDLRKLGLRTAEDHPRATSTAQTRFWSRQSVARRLLQADELLGSTDLVIAEAHRPLAVQTRYWETDLAQAMSNNPALTEEQAKHETAKFVAPPWIVPPHTTGGAVDVILMNGDRELAMGSGLNEQCEAMRTDYLDLDPEHRGNRQLLTTAMEAAGFINYGHEWWHFSYGDRYWAYATDSKAIYDSL